MPKPQPKLAVLETAEWYTKDRITTVRPLFQLLSMHVYDGDPNLFHYATFTRKASFVATFKDMVSKHGVNFICIGAHGENNKIILNKKEKSGNPSLFNSLFSRDIRGAASTRNLSCRLPTRRIGTKTVKQGVGTQHSGSLVCWLWREC